MKIKKLFIIIMLLLMAVLFIGINTYASNVSTETYLGKTINAIEAESYGDLSLNSVLSRDYRKNLDYDRESRKLHSKVETFYGSSRNKVMYEIQQKSTMNAGINNLPIKMFTLTAKGAFESENKYSETDYVSNEFYKLICTKEYYLYTIEDLKFKCNEFKRNLSDSYLDALNKLASNQISYETFFQMYGTHLVGGYKLGNKLYVEVSIRSNSKIIDASTADSIAADFKGALGETNGTASYSNTIVGNYGFDSKTDYVSTCVDSDSNVIVIPSSSNPVNLNEAFDRWSMNTNENTGTIISYEPNTLIPLWWFLPDNSPVSSTAMEEEFKKYAKDKEYVIPVSEVGHTFADIKSSYKRAEDTPIKDCDRFSNTIDRFSIDTVYGLNVLKEKYDKVEIYVTFKAKRNYLGDRYIYLYYGEDAYAGSNKHKDCISSSQVSLNTTSWYSRNRTYIIKCSDLKSKNFALVWRAAGSGKDTWHCKDVNVTITCYKK